MERQRRDKLWGYEDWLYDDGKVLLKRLCADRRLSVQVHPNDDTAKTVGGRAKAEMLYVMEAGPIFAGFRPGVTDEDVARAVEDGSFEDILVRFDAKVGECYFIPGGLVHAIGEGTVVFEVQQSSDTTFRLYDWDRVDAQGRARTLHVKEALAAMDVALPPPVPADSVSCAYFDFRRHDAGELPPSVKHRVIYDPVADAISELAPLATARFANPVFAVSLNLAIVER